MGQIGQAGQGRATGQLMFIASVEAFADDSDAGGTGAQEAASTPSRIAPSALIAGRFMWVIFLEMGVALGLLLLIVWWTWPKKRPAEKEKDRPD